MKLLPVLACVVVCLLGCKEQKDARAPQASPEPAPAASVSAPTPAPTAPMPHVVKKAAPEQIGSTLRVRMIRSGLPPKDCTAALMRSDEFPETAAVQGGNRCLLTLLRGWTEAQLRAPESRFFVFRNQADNDGEPRAASHPARLLQYDEASGVAALSFVEKFDSKTDVGFRLERSGVDATGLSAMISWTDRSEPAMFAARGPLRVPLQAALGDFDSHDGQRGQIRLTGAPEQRDESPLCISATGKLVGFFADEEGESALVSIGNLKLNVISPILKLTEITFRKRLGNEVEFSVLTEPTGGPAPTPERAFFRFVELAAGKDRSDAGDLGTTPAFEIRDVHPLVPPQPSYPAWRGHLLAPTEPGMEMSYRVQVGWPAASDETSASLFSPPFIVRLKNENGGIVPVVEGLQYRNPARQAQRGEEKKFALDTPVSDIREIAGGREVLMQFGSAPFWKRFSFTSNDWEPMPPGNLSSADVAGNLHAIYILDRGAAEVRKYALADLALMASVKLPTGKEFLAILAGSNSAAAPIHVLVKDEVISLDPDTLQRRALFVPGGRFHGWVNFDTARASRFQIAGDGLSITQSLDRFGVTELTYTGDAIGMHYQFFDCTENWGSARGSGVSGAFGVVSDGGFFTMASVDGKPVLSKSPAPNNPVKRQLTVSSPVAFRLIAESDRAVPPTLASVECESYFDTPPFSVVGTPELTRKSADGIPLEKFRHLAFDPYSRRMGIVSADQKSWVVHQVVADPESKRPVLLNWPDTSLVRGGEFRFKPEILKGKIFSAELIGNKEPTPVKIEGGTVSFQIARDELASFFLLTLKIPDAAGGELSCPIPLHVFGPQLPLVASPAVPADDMDSFGAGFKTLASPKQDWRVLQTGVHSFRDPVKEVAGVVAGHLVLISEANRVDFLSLQTGRVAGFFPASATASYCVGAEALFEYDSANRTLSRIGVPDGRRQQSMTMPGKLRLNAIALGADRSSPLTLILDEIQAQAPEQFGDTTFTATRFDRSIVILDSSSLRGGAWAQPKLLAESGDRAFEGNPYHFGIRSEKPVRLPASYDGLFISLPQVFIALGEQHSVAARYPDERTELGAMSQGAKPPRGSLSGMIVSNGMGATFTGGIGDKSGNTEGGTLDVSPCGRYRLVRANVQNGQGWVIEARTVQNNRAVFRTGRIALARQQFEHAEGSTKFDVSMLTPAGPMVILAAGGKSLQVVDFDIPKIARQLLPAEFHVTSQAAPCVMEGGSLDYQIQTNNPDAVAGFKLRAETEGATLTSGGLLHFNAPKQVAAPTKVNFSVEIAGKDGNTVLHEFPVFVIPFPKTAPSSKPGAPNKVPI